MLSVVYRLLGVEDSFSGISFKSKKICYFYNTVCREKIGKIVFVLGFSTPRVSPKFHLKCSHKRMFSNDFIILFCEWMLYCNKFCLYYIYSNKIY